MNEHYKIMNEPPLNNNQVVVRNYLDIVEKNLFLHKILYNFFYRFPFTLIMYITAFYPTSFYYHVVCFFFTYIQEQILFMLGHLKLHITFNYSKPTIDDMGLLCYGIGYLLHYYNSLLYSQINFYSYCNQYLDRQRQGSSFLNQYKSFTLNILCFFIPMYFIIPNNYNFLYLGMLTFKLGFVRYYFSYTIFLMKYYDVNNINISIYLCYQMIQCYLQAITHLWYHTLKSNRKHHFGKLLFYLMTFLEKIQVISSKQHKKHHGHHLHNLNEVEKWNDLYVPHFFNIFIDNIFKYAIQSNINHFKVKLYIKFLQLIVIIIFIYATIFTSFNI